MKTFKISIKKLIFLMSIAFIGSGSLFAQQSGVFKTFSNYQKGVLDYGINCSKESHKIRLNDFLNKDHVTVIHEGKAYKLKKDEIWGLLLCNQTLIRFQGHEDFAVNDKGILWIYTKQKNIVSGKVGNFKTITTYYFSKDGNGEIKELTLLNLKTTYPENHMLHDKIDKQFTTDASLTEFDQFHKKYKINHFLEGENLK